jgi:hypothetical protein
MSTREQTVVRWQRKHHDLAGLHTSELPFDGTRRDMPGEGLEHLPEEVDCHPNKAEPDTNVAPD